MQYAYDFITHSLSLPPLSLSLKMTIMTIMIIMIIIIIIIINNNNNNNNNDIYKAPIL